MRTETDQPAANFSGTIDEVTGGRVLTTNGVGDERTYYVARIHGEWIGTYPMRELAEQALAEHWAMTGGADLEQPGPADDASEAFSPAAPGSPPPPAPAQEFEITIAEHKATEAGALDGYGFRCSCGNAQTTSLGETAARDLAFDHAAWHRLTGDDAYLKGEEGDPALTPQAAELERRQAERDELERRQRGEAADLERRHALEARALTEAQDRRADLGS